MKLNALKKDIKEHEGFVPHAYQDSLGFWTIGYGRLIDSRRGGRITESEANMLLENDIMRAERRLARNLMWYDTAPWSVQRALINMCFQLGWGGLSGFKKMLGHLEAGEYRKAAQEALKSRWAEQTPKRALWVADRFIDAE